MFELNFVAFVGAPFDEFLCLKIIELVSYLLSLKPSAKSKVWILNTYHPSFSAVFAAVSVSKVPIEIFVEEAVLIFSCHIEGFSLTKS